jgi:hypothetical protein
VARKLQILIGKPGQECDGPFSLANRVGAVVACPEQLGRIVMRVFVIAGMTLVGFIAVDGLHGQDRGNRQGNRDERRQDRQAARMAQRTDYYSQATWNQVNPWVAQYGVQPLRPLARAAEAVDQATEAVNRARFGFDDGNQPATAWFYDWYTWSPSYYYPANETATDYARAARYYDFDHDGVYESYWTHRDTDRDGRYDEFDRYDFTAWDTVESAGDDSPNDARRHAISGKIDATKKARVNETEFLIVRVATTAGDSVVVDLGPVKLWSDVKVQSGDEIEAIGPMELLGDKQVLMAETATVGKQGVRIVRSTRRYEGTVEEFKKINFENAEHLFVVVTTDAGNQVIDLGPAVNLKVQLEPKAKIVVHGVPIRAYDHQIIVADQFEFDGEQYVISRWADR